MTGRQPEAAGAPIVGRFAPSPTGPLHFGSLYAALASYLDIVSRGGTWLIRVEDIDPPREVHGSRQAILEALTAHGLVSDEPVVYQSGQTKRHLAMLQQLDRAGLLFYCTCSRRSLASVAGPYPGTCRNRRQPPDRDHAVRFRIGDGPDVSFSDEIRGPHHYRRAELGDFIVRRRDGLVAYHLAVVTDDASQGITSVLRGADLLDSTPLHICLQQALGLSQPEYLHIPILTHQGAKLSKQTGAAAVSLVHPVENLCRALALLGQPVPSASGRNHVAGVLQSACRQWQRALVPDSNELALDDDHGPDHG